MQEYMTVKEAAKKWGISQRRVQMLCSNNRIDGAMKWNRSWAIPRKAKKPKDERKTR